MVALNNVHFVPNRVYLWDHSEKWQISQYRSLIKANWVKTWNKRKNLYEPLVPSASRLSSYLQTFQEELKGSITAEEFSIALSQHDHFQHFFQSQLLVAQWEKKTPKFIKVDNYQIAEEDTKNWDILDIQVPGELQNCVMLCLAYLIRGDPRFYLDMKAIVLQEYIENSEYYKNYGFSRSILIKELQGGAHSNAAIHVASNAFDTSTIVL